MLVSDLVSVFGNQTQVADKVGHPKTTISQWKKRGIPYDTQCRLYYDFRRKLNNFKPDRAHAPQQLAKAG